MLERDRKSETQGTNEVAKGPDFIVTRVPIRSAEGYLVGSTVVRLPIPKALPKTRIPAR